MPALIRGRDLRLLLGGQAVSALGDWMATFALMALAYDLSGSSAAVGGMLVLRLIPAGLAGPLVARVVHRWDRRETMLAMDLLRAGMVVLLPLVSALWWVYVWAFLLELANLIFLPARDASIPDLADEETLPTANGLILGSSYGTIPLGAGAFAVVAALGGGGRGSVAGQPYALVFWIDALTYLVSWGLLRRITSIERRPAEAGGGADTGAAGFTRAFRLGLVRGVMPATVAVALGVGTLFSLGIVFVRDVLGATTAEFGVLIALFGVGAATGLALVERLGGGQDLVTVRLGVLVQGGVIAAMSLAPTLAFAFLGAAGFGAGAAIALVAGMGTLQSRLEGDDRVLAFAAFHVVIRSALSLAALGAGLAADLVDAVHWPVVGDLEPERVVLLCSGLLVLAGASAVYDGGRKVVGDGRRRRH